MGLRGALLAFDCNGERNAPRTRVPQPTGVDVRYHEVARELLDRGLKIDQGLLCVLDGAKGLRKAVDKVFAPKAVVQRCTCHKRENVVRYLAANLQPTYRRKLQTANEKPTYAQAKASLMKVRSELAQMNESAVASLDEGLRIR